MQCTAPKSPANLHYSNSWYLPLILTRPRKSFILDFEKSALLHVYGLFLTVRFLNEKKNTNRGNLMTCGQTSLMDKWPLDLNLENWNCQNPGFHGNSTLINKKTRDTPAARPFYVVSNASKSFIKIFEKAKNNWIKKSPETIEIWLVDRPPSQLFALVFSRVWRGGTRRQLTKIKKINGAKKDVVVFRVYIELNIYQKTFRV